MNSDMADGGAFDAVVAGGGLAGGLAALALARGGFDVALVDAQTPGHLRADAFDGRTTALAYASIRVFKRLGVWEAAANEAEPIRDILVTDGRRASALSKGALSPFHLHFDSAELGEDEPLGCIVENRVLRAALLDAVAREPRIRFLAPACVVAAKDEGPAARVELADGRIIRARIVVAADGKASPLRRAAGIGARAWSYRQAGIVVTVAHERDHQGVAQEFFLASGPFAILPMTRAADGRWRSSLVWTEREDAAPAYLALAPDAFDAEINARFGDYLGPVRALDPRWSYPLSFHFSRRFVAPRLALIGDAARAIHPIAGQGFNLGVKDVAALADAVSKAASLGLDIGSAGVLEDYERWRRFDSAALAFGTDALNRLFSNDIAPLRLIRSAGMAAAGAAAPMRRFFMRQAGADLGVLPELMRPMR
jgi:2-octaprenyl-6-methoxyphenol hydroxylase